MQRKHFHRRSVYLVFSWVTLLLFAEFSTVGESKKVGGIGRTGGRSGSRIGTSRSGTGSRISQPTSHNRPSSGGTGVGVGAGGYKKPSSGGSWKKPALAGAGGAIAGAVIGAAVSHQLTKNHYKYGYGGRDYYYGDRYYHPSYSYSRKCVNRLEEDKYMRYDDGYSVKEIVFECDGRTEHCCGMECCRNMVDNTYARRPTHVYTRNRLPWWAILLIIICIIGLVSCCVLAFKKYRRQNTSYAGTGGGDTSVPLQAAAGGYPDANKAYAAQPGGYYPNAPTYPAGGWQGQSAYAPAGPPQYGFNVQSGPTYPRQY